MKPERNIQRPLRVAYDIDDTIYKINNEKRRQEPDYELIAVLKWFANNGDEVYLWSAAGPDYCRIIAEKLGIDVYVKDYIPKPELHGYNPDIDITFDDCEIGLGNTNVLVRRHHGHRGDEA